VSSSKSELRAGIRARRRSRTESERELAAAQLRDRVLALPQSTGESARVAIYLSSPEEPGTGPLLDVLLASAVQVLVPVLLPDFDLDWTLVEPDRGQLVPSPVAGGGRLQEPDGTRLGPSAIAGAELIVVPALAVDGYGRRLGQGGGSYDRALARVPAGVPVVELLFDDEILDDIAAEPHDRAVRFAVTPNRTVTFG
jgi:5-formyltetrahydrofolate cyclo-ligase